MRVAVVADDLYPGYGGQAAATESHIEALLALGHEVRALAGRTSSPTQPPEVTVRRLPVWRPGDRQTQLVLPRREEIQSLLDWADVVQANTPTPLALLTLWLAGREGVPSVLGFHTQEESMTLHLNRLRPLIQPVLRRWYKVLHRQPDCLTAPTAFAAGLARRYTSCPVHVVSNGVRLPERGAADGERAGSLRRRLLSERRFLIVYVGRLAPEKRPEGLLEVMAALTALRWDVRLVVAGEGPRTGALEKEAARLGLSEDIHFLGYVSEEKEDLLEAGDLFLMPSPTELQSIATLEAMAGGCAVAAARYPTSAVCEVVRESGCGLCYAPERAGEAAENISRLLDSPDELRRLQHNAREAAQRHDIHESGRRLEGIYHGLLENRSLKGDAVE